MPGSGIMTQQSWYDGPYEPVISQVPCLLHRSAQHAPFSAIRTIALGLPVTSSTVCHPTDGRRRIRAERSATQDGERQKQSHRAVRPQ
jgi:hypothetical protein